MLKSGLPAWGTVGDPNAVIDSAEPRQLAAQFGGIGGAAVDTSVIFTNAAAVDAGADTFPTRRRRVAVQGCREVTLADMVHHRERAAVTVAPGGDAVHLDGHLLSMSPVERVPLSRLYFL